MNKELPIALGAEQRRLELSPQLQPQARGVGHDALDRGALDGRVADNTAGHVGGGGLELRLDQRHDLGVAVCHQGGFDAGELRGLQERQSTSSKYKQSARF